MPIKKYDDAYKSELYKSLVDSNLSLEKFLIRARTNGDKYAHFTKGNLSNLIKPLKDADKEKKKAEEEEKTRKTAEDSSCSQITLSKVETAKESWHRQGLDGEIMSLLPNPLSDYDFANPIMISIGCYFRTMDPSNDPSIILFIRNTSLNKPDLRAELREKDDYQGAFFLFSGIQEILLRPSLHSELTDFCYLFSNDSFSNRYK